jgi:hypothetical protein
MKRRYYLPPLITLVNLRAREAAAAGSRYFIFHFSFPAPLNPQSASSAPAARWRDPSRKRKRKLVQPAGTEEISACLSIFPNPSRLSSPQRLQRKCCHIRGPSRRDGWAGRLTAVPQYGARDGARHLIELDRYIEASRQCLAPLRRADRLDSRACARRPTRGLDRRRVEIRARGPIYRARGLNAKSEQQGSGIKPKTKKENWLAVGIRNIQQRKAKGPMPRRPGSQSWVSSGTVW